MEERKTLPITVQRINELRQKRRQTIKQLADVAGVSYSMMQYILTGKRRATQHDLMALADHFDVSVDYLCGRTDQVRGTILFRKLQSLSPEDLERVNAMIDVICHDNAKERVRCFSQSVSGR